MKAKKKSVRHSERYSSYKRQQYLKQVKLAERTLSDEGIEKQLYRIVSQRVYDYVKKLKPTEFTQLRIMPKAVLLQQSEKLTREVRVLLTNRFQKTLRQLWKNAFRTGVRHQILDVLYNSGLFKQAFSKLPGKITGFSGAGEELARSIAEFADEDGGDGTVDPRAIAQARRNYTKLRNNLDNLVEAGLYDELRRGSGIAARLNLEERLTFFEVTEEISNYARRAQVAERDFIGNTYMQRRFRVLSDEYASVYDDYVKEKIYDYLTTNVEGTRQIRDTFRRADNTTRQIYDALISSGAIGERVDPAPQSKMILRTELNLAYNLGKVSGFTSPEDMDREFQIKADWDLQDALPDYKVCTFCRRMDGQILSAREILFMGTQGDRNVLRYQGRTRTSFKDEDNLVLPFHPNCNCYYVVVPETWEDRELREAAAEPIQINAGDRFTTQPLLQLYQQQQQQTDTQNITNALLAIAGTSLVVGGLFLLARGNVYKSFIQTSGMVDEVVEGAAKVVKPKTKPPAVEVEDVLTAGDYIKEEGLEEVTDQFSDLMTEVLQEPP